jgi:hypothetical protein
MTTEEQKSHVNIDLISLLKLVIGNSFDYILLFFPLLIIFKIYSQYHSILKESKLNYLLNLIYVF